jgi:hypothetical protein
MEAKLQELRALISHQNTTCKEIGRKIKVTAEHRALLFENKDLSKQILVELNRIYDKPIIYITSYKNLGGGWHRVRLIKNTDLNIIVDRIEEVINDIKNKKYKYHILDGENYINCDCFVSYCVDGEKYTTQKYLTIIMSTLFYGGIIYLLINKYKNDKKIY